MGLSIPDHRIDQEEQPLALFGRELLDLLEPSCSKLSTIGTEAPNLASQITNNEFPAFAASYNYADNENVDIANFHNPQVQSGGGPATHQWAFGYDGLNRLSEADFGNNGTTGTFDVAGLEYDDAGNITDLQRRDDSGNLIDNLSYDYSGSTNIPRSLTTARRWWIPWRR